MNRRLRTALAVTAVIGSGLLMTACGGGDESSASDSSAASSSQASPTASSGGEGGDTSGSGTSKSSGGGTAGSGSSDKSGTSGGDSAGGDSSGDKSGYGQSCGTNDISWSVSSESQAGGYFLIKAQAKSGITCILPAELPVVAFGSDGTQAEPAEQSAGQPITLRAGVTAYAGVNPKTTNEDGGKELDSLIVSVANDDPNPESLKVDSYVVDKPVVTSWHTSPADAVPFSS
ncbi:DUF4232 domain-containing protein [Streptomyces sp. NPDC056948]|uniref:DUF4232 domain-containing protein n=1 Tax=Streptomyces sp. NPDC056948 TaxID=3345975 RepID=UPI00363690A4